MSNPYYSLADTGSARPRPRPPPAEANPRPAPPEARQGQSAVLSKATRKKPVLKPSIRFNVRPRFRFDLPEPPMDPKMLLGALSTASYAHPHVSQLERNARAVATPADPTHGLRANLVESSLYAHKAALSVDDQSLLRCIAAGLPFDPTGKNLLSADGKKVSLPVAWLRASCYDEYTGSTMNRTTLEDTARRAALKVEEERRKKPEYRQRRRKALMNTFDAARRRPIQHPDMRKGHLTPVSIAPIFLDFRDLGEEFIVLDFERDAPLTHVDRMRMEPEETEQSVRTTATISVAEGDNKRKFVACYTPSDRTLEKRKRIKEDEDGPDVSEQERKKVRFIEEETYDWVREYAIREGQYGTDGADGQPSRSCYAVSQFTNDDGKSHVACLSRVTKSWKLSRRPGTMPRLGKPALKIQRNMDSEDEDDDKFRVKRNIVTGASQAKIEAKKEKHRMAAMLEED